MLPEITVFAAAAGAGHHNAPHTRVSQQIRNDGLLDAGPYPALLVPDFGIVVRRDHLGGTALPIALWAEAIAWRERVEGSTHGPPERPSPRMIAGSVSVLARHRSAVLGIFLDTQIGLDLIPEHPNRRRRDSSDDRAGRDRTCHDTAGGDDRSFSDVAAGQNRGRRPDVAAGAHARCLLLRGKIALERPVPYACV